MIEVKSYAAHELGAELKPYTFNRRDVGPKDVQIDIHYCGVCHSDLHSVNGDWGGENFPLVVGHEIVGKVLKVGANAKKFKAGDTVGVGCFVDSCRTCASCKEGFQQYCEATPTQTYGSPDTKHGGHTMGGYSTQIVVDEDFVLRIPNGLPLDQAAPLLCAGITMYSPLRHWKVKKGDRVGVAGLGGLGHVAVKLAVAMGAEVTVLSTSENKKKDATKLGAHKFVVTKNPKELEAHSGYFDLILNSISAPHEYATYLNLLKRDATMVLLGVPPPQAVSAGSLIMKRKNLAGSLVGGIPETQEMLNFCAEHKITADIEVIPMNKINQSFQRMVKGDVHYRFVIDMQSLK
jgi:uncharacterized zinc-type alcohol dehydrogenase-like protein